MGVNAVRLSKIISHALRHEPWLYGLELDAQGWVDVDELLTALAAADSRWLGLTEQDLASLIERSAKRRHELRAGQIRALYGHSTLERITKPPEQPPEMLYHGTSPLKIPAIRKEGLRPMRRQYVHLSTTEAIAREVGRRKHTEPTVLRVLADKAWRSGTVFYKGNELVWLAEHIGPEFLE
jgi:putative RNA 2'-phosphotransferase